MIDWEIKDSVEANVPRSFAWRYWTDVSNWADPPATFALQGAFEPGARGITQSPGQTPVHWLIRDVQPGESAAIEIEVDKAVFTFRWRFEEATTGRTRILQSIVFCGQDCVEYEQAREAFAANLPAGMRKLAAAMEQAAAGSVNG